MIGGDGVVIIDEFEPSGVRLPPVCPNREFIFRYD